ncbi:hypothetical protein F4809DRAFT_604906 [Biscogniauxia mediterranea]|nr:hypothetical protein F4809DRAFT_604906 [Biscogniauxia mediterranea]
MDYVEHGTWADILARFRAARQTLPNSLPWGVFLVSGFQHVPIYIYMFLFLADEREREGEREYGRFLLGYFMSFTHLLECDVLYVKPEKEADNSITEAY